MYYVLCSYILEKLCKKLPQILEKEGKFECYDINGFIEVIRIKMTAAFRDRFFKVPFSQRVRFVFQISKSQKKLFQKTILSLKFEIPAHTYP